MGRILNRMAKRGKGKNLRSTRLKEHREERAKVQGLKAVIRRKG